MILANSDSRRDLYESVVNDFTAVVKTLYVKEDCVIGDHYHKNKDEFFLLVVGGMDAGAGFVSAPFQILIKRGTYHKFEIKKGSVLICLASKEHDPSDDHKQ